MESKIKIIKRPNILRSFVYNFIHSIIIIVMMLTGIQVSLQAQEQQYTKPAWWFGLAAGANFNFYRGSTQNLNADLTVPTTFHNGNSVGLYVAPLVEYQFPNTGLGISMHVGYDGRSGSFNQVITPCNCPADLNTNLSYLTVEPSFRIAPFNSNLYLYGGPRFAFNLSKAFTYKLGINPKYPDQAPTPDINGDFASIRKSLVSLQIGAGYDIPISSSNKELQFIVSPFVSFQPYYGQSPRSIETWNLTTLRIGAALKFGRGTKIIPPEKVVVSESKVVIPIPEVNFSIVAPKNIIAERRVTEMFPIRNYVFFDIGIVDIPGRYVLLNKDQARVFKEDQLNLYTPQQLPSRSQRQMVVYHNVLNILGYRMANNGLSTITLVGSSENGPADGMAMAKSIKQYLVDVFGINATRINTEGRDKPLIPSGSGQAYEPSDVPLLLLGNRRVSIENSSPIELMDIKSNQDLLLKPVGIIAEQKSPVDSYVSFYVDGSKKAFSSWALEIKDEKGELKNYGPFSEDTVLIPGKSILGVRPEADYKVTMVGQTSNGDVVKKETSMHLLLSNPAVSEEGSRYSVIFEFDESNLLSLYDKYLNESVIPNIPKGSRVIIHGYTDIIGEENHNKELSMARANSVRNILENGLIKAGINDVKFEVFGFGEDQSLSPFANKYPEENFYNRTVIIDIIPNK